MRENFGYEVKDFSDKSHKELKAEEVYRIFTKNHLDISTPLAFERVHYVQSDSIEATVNVKYKGKSIYDVLEMSVEEGISFFEGIPADLQAHKRTQEMSPIIIFLRFSIMFFPSNLSFASECFIIHE